MLCAIIYVKNQFFSLRTSAKCKKLINTPLTCLTTIIQCASFHKYFKCIWLSTILVANLFDVSVQFIFQFCSRLFPVNRGRLLLYSSTLDDIKISVELGWRRLMRSGISPVWPRWVRLNDWTKSKCRLKFPYLKSWLNSTRFDCTTSVSASSNMWHSLANYRLLLFEKVECTQIGPTNEKISILWLPFTLRQ